MKLSLTLAAAAAAVVCLAAPSPASSHSRQWHDLSLRQKDRVVAHQISVHRSVIRSWLTLRRRSFASAGSFYCASIGIRAPGPICIHGQRLVAGLHLRARIEAKIRARSQPRFDSRSVDAFTCIHGFEGAWNANTGNGYYGGLQMDSRFMTQYGPDYMAQWGTADKWPIWAQLQAGIRARDGWPGPDPATHSGRGYGPWPNTARDCGLL